MYLLVINMMLSIADRHRVTVPRKKKRCNCRSFNRIILYHRISGVAIPSKRSDCRRDFAWAPRFYVNKYTRKRFVPTLPTIILVSPVAYPQIRILNSPYVYRFVSTRMPTKQQVNIKYYLISMDGIEDFSTPKYKIDAVQIAFTLTALTCADMR